MTIGSTSRVKSSAALIVGGAALAIGLFVMLSAGALRDSGDGDSDLGSGAPLIETATPVAAKNSYMVTAAGRLRAREGTALIGEVAGKITWISDNFILGARLKEGELLFRLDQSDYIANVVTAEASVASAKAMLELAENTFERRSDLVKSGAVSAQANDDAIANLDNAKAGLKQAEAQLVLARKNLARTEFRAPYPARVVEDNVSLDTYVAPGQQLGTITDTRMGELQAGLTPKDTKALADMLVAGKRVKAIARPNSGSLSTGVLEGYIDRFNPVVDRTSRTAQVIALFPDAFAPQWDGKIFGDDFMTLEVEVTMPQTVWQVPAGSVRKDAFVWAVRNNKLHRIDVEVLTHKRAHSLVTAADTLGAEKILNTILNEEHQDKEVATKKRVAAVK